MARSSFSFLFLSTLMLIHSGKFNFHISTHFLIGQITDVMSGCQGCLVDKVKRSVIPPPKDCSNKLLPKFLLYYQEQ